MGDSIEGRIDASLTLSFFISRRYKIGLDRYLLIICQLYRVLCRSYIIVIVRLQPVRVNPAV